LGQSTRVRGTPPAPAAPPAAPFQGAPRTSKGSSAGRQSGRIPKGKPRPGSPRQSPREGSPMAFPGFLCDPVDGGGGSGLKLRLDSAESAF
jgi:hypothetical protein